MKTKKEKNNFIPLIFGILRIIFGSVFIFSSVIKLFDLNNFRTAITMFSLVPDSFIPTISILIVVLELMVGIFIVLNIKIAFFSKISILIISFFTAVIVLKLFEGADISCGCFGDLSKDKIDGFTILRNVILLICAFIIEIYYAKRVIKVNEAGTKKIFNEFLLNHIKNIFLFEVFVFLIAQNFVFSMQNKALKDRLTMIVNDKNTLMVGDYTKEFKAWNMENDEMNITFPHDKNTLLFIFRIDCGPCKINSKNWVEINSKIKNSNVRIIGVSLDSVKNTNVYASENKFAFLVFSAPHKEFKLAYKAYLTPQTILISDSGKVLNVWNGVLNDNINKQIGVLKRVM